MVVSTIKRLYNAFFPSTSLTVQSTETVSRPLKFGILGAAAIAPPALIIPAKTHPEVVVYAVAARDVKRAEVYAQKHGIEKFYGGAEGYQKLLDDPEVEVVYNPLPNGLHYEWTMKALAAGKHVLLEKPAADTAEETRQMFELAEKKNLVLMEAFHYRFHPAIQRVKAIIDSGELGRLKSIENKLTTPAGFIKKDDIRFNLSLGGGSLMDMGCYTLNCLRYLSGTNPTQVLTAVASPSTSDSKVDRSMTATFDLPNDVFGSITCDLGVPWRFGLIPALPQVSSTVECEGGQVHIMNFVLPTLYHTIKVTKKKSGGNGKTETETRIEQVYNFADGKMEGKGEDWWLTYRYQLEAFVDKIKGRTPQTWVSKEDSVANMEWIERVYAKSGLGARPKSTFTLN